MGSDTKEIDDKKSKDCIKPGVVIDGEVFHPPGWMYVLAFALNGNDWAVKKASDPKFRENIQEYLAKEKNDNIKATIEHYEARIEELKQRLDGN